MTDVLDIPPALDRRPFIGTYTNLRDFRNCEHMMYRRYVLRDQPYAETAAIKFGNEGHAAFEARVGKRIPLKPPFDQWEKHATPFDEYEVTCEQKLGIDVGCRSVDFWDKTVWFRTKIDVVVAINDKALITDWKFANPQYEDPFELRINALLLKAKYPELRTVVGRYVYPKIDKVGTMHDLSDFKETWDEINDLMDLIAEKRKSGEWVKKKSGLFGWCSVADCENHFVARP